MQGLADRLPEATTRAKLEGFAWALRDWFSRGLPLTVSRTVDDAVALAKTDPPAWDTPVPTGGGQWALARFAGPESRSNSERLHSRSSPRHAPAHTKRPTFHLKAQLMEPHGGLAANAVQQSLDPFL
jgi:hypothetical protein